VASLGTSIAMRGDKPIVAYIYQGCRSSFSLSSVRICLSLQNFVCSYPQRDIMAVRKDTYPPNYVENLENGPKDAKVNGLTPTLDRREEKKLIRKIDYRLLPILGAMYSISLIDRTNVCIATLTCQAISDSAIDL
jgi:hypothetical protein